MKKFLTITSRSLFVLVLLFCIFKSILVPSDFDLSSVTNGENMFRRLYGLSGGAGTAFNDNHTNSEYAHIDDPEHGRPGYFTRRSN